MQRERGLIVGIEIGPVHRHDDIAPRSHDLGNPQPEQVPRKHACVAEQPIDLFDRRLGDQSTRRRQSLPDQGNSERCPRHHSECPIAQRKNAFGMQVAAKHSAQEIMNEIKSFLRRAHNSPSQIILHPAAWENPKVGLFKVAQK